MGTVGMLCVCYGLVNHFWDFRDSSEERGRIKFTIFSAYWSGCCLNYDNVLQELCKNRCRRNRGLLCIWGEGDRHSKRSRNTVWEAGTSGAHQPRQTEISLKQAF